MPAITIPAPDTDIDAYLSVPPLGEGPWPAVVLIHDIFGLTDMARDHADRMATAGYLTVAVDLYSRGGLVRCVQATMKTLLSQRGRAFDDIELVRRWALERSDTTDRVGTIGFCMGGGFALATASSGFAAAAPNYGPLPKDLDAALSGACPVVASYGRKDRGLGRAAADLERELTERGVAHDVKEYPDAGHSFLERFNTGPFNPLVKMAGMGYHQPSAEDAWRRIFRFFDQHLGAGASGT